MTQVVDLYTIQIIDDGGEDYYPGDGIPELVIEAEENLTDLLPDGYRARIRRWNNPYPDERNDDA